VPVTAARSRFLAGALPPCVAMDDEAADGGAMAMLDGAGPSCGTTPASFAPYGTAAVLHPASVPPTPARPTPSSSPRLVGRGSSRGCVLTTFPSSVDTPPSHVYGTPVPLAR